MYINDAFLLTCTHLSVELAWTRSVVQIRRIKISKMPNFAFVGLLFFTLVCYTCRAIPIYPNQALLLKMNAKLDTLEKKVDAIKTCLCHVAQGKHCADLYKKGYRTDGVYSIDPDGQGAFKVRCDMTTSGGGWTIFQRRINGSVDFYRYWKDYKNGFGDPLGEYWLGLDKINRLTNSGKNILRVDMKDTTGNTKYAEYNFFSVAAENAKYKLGLGTYSGTAGDSLGYQRGMPFSTRDVDNDFYSSGNCAVRYKGAWWYNNCHLSNLNGVYHHGKHSSYADGINWKTWKGYYYSLKKTEMKLRPSGFP